MKSSTLAQRNTSEKGRRAAQATKTATADRKAAEERKLLAIKSGMRKSALPGDVPPFCYRVGGRTPEEAAVEAVKHFSLTSIEALGLVWKLRQVAAEDAAYIAAAEVPSACNTSAKPIPSDLSTSIIGTTHKTTPKQSNEKGLR